MKRLNLYYYGMLVLAVIAATVTYFLIMKDIVLPIDPLSVPGQVIQYIIILDAIVSIPLGLWLHKRVCTRLAQQDESEQRTQAYYRSAARRIFMVSNAMVLGIAAFYLMGGYMSMLWLAGISAIGWYFTKPTEKKMFMELQPEQY
ncbi:MAG: hypothetical protein MJZ79_01180 [Paludibacteraceae bacterium]|nr:hypothetical protein [Paludibacteraceae bacterium]